MTPDEEQRIIDAVCAALADRSLMTKELVVELAAMQIEIAKSELNQILYRRKDGIAGLSISPDYFWSLVPGGAEKDPPQASIDSHHRKPVSSGPPTRTHGQETSRVRRPGHSRNLLRKLSIERIRRLVDHFQLPRARSIEEMVDGIARRVGPDLARLVSDDGPLSAGDWNEIAIELGGQARRGFDGIREELVSRLDRVVREFDMDERISAIRDDGSSTRRLAQLLDMDRDALVARLQATHGRTLLGRFVADLREERALNASSSPGAVAGEREDRDDEGGDSSPEETQIDAASLLVRLLRDQLSAANTQSSWPLQGTLTINTSAFNVSIYARVVGGSSRGNPLERRFQNPSQGSPIVDDPTRYELLFGLWTEQGEDRAVIVAFDAYRRIGRTTRFSLFMPVSLLEQAADTGYATHENNKGETLYAFRPENIGRYIQQLIDSGFWTLERTPSAAPSPAPKREKQRSVDTLKPPDGSTVYIRPRVGMYAAFARLNYRPWFALAEFVDNSIQSFLQHREKLIAEGHEGPLLIDINIEENEISITDRAGGISGRDFPRAFSPAAPPDDPSGLSEFGLGMKAAACWFARKWSVRTSALGESLERTVLFDIGAISRDGLESLPIESRSAREGDHFTVVTMMDLRVHPRGRTLAKIRDHLRSIYRVLTADGIVKLRLTMAGRTEELAYEPPELLDAPYYRTPRSASQVWRKEFAVDFHDKKVRGWAGILRKGSHAQAGFSVFRRRRLIEGSIGETYKPHVVFGNPNSFAYQRVVGEIFVDGFDVTHTKDGIQWHGYEDEILESIRRQIDSPSMPLLDQADGYRARKSAESLPASFGSDALTDTVDAFSLAAGAVEQPVLPPPDVEAPSVPEVPAAPVFQKRELSMQIMRDGKPWLISLELVRDAAAPFYSTSVVTRNGEDVVVVQINLEHDFSVTFINEDEALLQPIMRLVAALALGERIARNSGVKNAGAVRHISNEILQVIGNRRGAQ